MSISNLIHSLKDDKILKELFFISNFLTVDFPQNTEFSLFQNNDEVF